MDLTFLSNELSTASKTVDLRVFPFQKAAVAELVDAADLKSADPRSSGFESRRRYF